MQGNCVSLSSHRFTDTEAAAAWLIKVTARRPFSRPANSVSVQTRAQNGESGTSCCVHLAAEGLFAHLCSAAGMLSAA